MEDKKLALLIDAENTSSKYIDAIIRELKEYGTITYQRMYGDFSNQNLNDWNKKALNYAIVPIQQPRYACGKNAADIMLVIDAMDILYQNKTDGFCIVTSDSDFTRLVNRLREQGMFVIGMGKSNASKTFIAACNEYKFLDKIADEEDNGIKNNENGHDSKGNSQSNSITPLMIIKSSINEMIQQCENSGKHAHLGSVKSSLQKLYPEFDERNYGYNSMRKFITEATKFELIQDGTAILVVRETDNKEITVELQVREYIKKQAKNSIGLGKLGQEISERYPTFKCKNHGYSRLSKYVSSIQGVKVENSHVFLESK